MQSLWDVAIFAVASKGGFTNIVEVIQMKKEMTYDKVLGKLTEVLENSGVTNEEAYVILESIQQKMLYELLKKIKAI